MSKAWNSQGSTTVTTFSTPSSSSSSQRQIRNLDSSKYGAKMPRRNLAVTRSTKPDLKTQSAIESALGVNDTAMVTGLEPPSKLEKPQVGIYIDRFGMQKIIGQVSLQKTPSPELPTESHRKESGREIVSTAALPPMPTKIDLYRLQEIRTRRRTSEICRVFSRGFCDWGKSCKHIHIFDTLDQTNEKVLRDVFKGQNPEVADTEGKINQACLSFIDGRCRMAHRCLRIHLIPPSISNSSTDPREPSPKVKIPQPSFQSDAGSSSLRLTTRLDSAICNPFTKPTKATVKLGSSDSDPGIMLPSKEDCESYARVWLDPDPDPSKWTSETDMRQWLDPSLNVDKWSCETDASIWLDSASESSETSTSSLSSSSTLSNVPVKRPPPRSFETCWRWLRGTCERGYSCFYVHGDLEYDYTCADTRPAPPPTYFMANVHDHIRIKLSAGFSIQEIVTGFETPWLYVNNIPTGTLECEISRLLSKHGTIQDIALDHGSGRGFQRARVRFSNNIEARNANVSLNGTKQWGSIISTQLPVNTAGGRSATLQDNAIRIEWEAPSIVGYAGYPTEERAKKAIAIAKAAYSTTYISAHIYTGLPQMAAYTVRFRNLPINTKKGHMFKYASPLDMMWDMPNYTSVDDVAVFLRWKLDTSGIEIISFDVLPPPYRDGMVRAWVYFPTPSAAKDACTLLHLRKPTCTGRTRIFAYHMQTLSYSIPAEKFKNIAEDISIFRERLRREAFPGITLTVAPSGAQSVSVKLSAVDRKDLGHLKAEFEKLRGGEIVRNNGEILWDRFFGLAAGKVYLRQLEIDHLGLSIREDVHRRRITLFGQAKLRQMVKAILIEKVAELSVRERRYLFLGHLLGPFIRYKFSDLSERLGHDKVYLDFWNRRLVVSGQDHEFRIALQAVQNVQRKQFPQLRRNVASCPVCLGEVDCPVMLSQCKHSYCRTCLVSYLQSAIDGKCFPLTCLGDDDRCSIPIPISVARQVLSLGEFDALVEAAFEAYIHERPQEFHYCPSPDCMQVYRPAPSGNVLQCPSCLLRICPQCHVEQHDGLDCPDRDGGDRLFNEWAKTHNVKNCPSCRAPIERAEGCNHVTCIRCRTHICWVCMGTFPGGDGIYSHMRAEHGGIGNAFDADGL